MKYPKINKQPIREVNVPELSGGVNLRDSITGVRDNQLIDSVNMWYKDGMLRTRPTFETNVAMLNMTGRNDIDEKIDTRFHGEIKVLYDGVSCVCATNKRIVTNEDSTVSCNIEFEFQSADKIFVMPTISGIAGGEEITYFCTEMGGILYCYVSDFSIWKLEYSKILEDDEVLAWEEVTLDKRYVPTVYAHCQRTGWDDFEGTQFEGYNLIGNSYKMIYSAYNEADSDKTHPMRYKLGQELPDKGIIKVEITTCVKGEDETDERKTEVITTEHIIKYKQKSTEDDSTVDDGYECKDFKNGEIIIERFGEGKTSTDGLRLFLKYNYIGFVIASEDDGNEDKVFVVATLDTDTKRQRYACNEDNVVITAPLKVNEDEQKKVFCMTRSTWFGGAANGINGGSRLFLCGNTQDKEKSLVLWSGLNEPLYFGENCYAYVGGKSHAVTAFGRQGENLIIFKENKIYCTYYVQNTAIDADDLINQTVVDYEANSAYFPMIQINGFIGCDCPDTVQMCRNRLVWASSEGRVYTLCTMSQYNEHTVYDISEMISPKLKEYKERIKTATSADFDGHYVLFLEDCALVANYSCYGYQYIYSYSKSDDANALIPWYCWDFSFLKTNDVSDKYERASVCMLNDVLLMRAYFNASVDNKAALVGFVMRDNVFSGVDTAFYNDLSNSDLQLGDNSIDCSVTTKLFELGSGIYNVNVDSVALKTGANNGTDIVVTFITEQGEENMVIKEKREFTTLTATDFVKSKWIRPRARAILKFGLRFCSKGRLAIDGVAIRYRLLGGAK